MPDTNHDDKTATDKVSRKANYGWIIAITGASIMFVNAQFLYSFGVFVRPLIDNFGWSRGAISSIASTRSIITALLSPVAGTLTDRYGSKKLIILGVFLCGLAFILSWRATSLWQFYLTLGVLIGISNGIIITPTLVTVNKWFAGKSSLANGITMTGPSLAQILVPPTVTFLIVRYGWENSLIIIGVAIWLLGTSAWSFFRSPATRATAQLPSQTTINSKPNNANSTDFTLSEALHTTSFWIIFTVYVVAAICFQAVVIHIVVAAIDIGATPAAAAGILTVMGITNTVGRLVISGLSDRFGKTTVLAIAMGLTAVLLFLLAQAADLGTFYIVTALYGMFYGSTIPNILSLGSSLFGMKAVGAIIGTLTLGYLAGAAIGPVLGGCIFDATGSYYIAFLITAIASGIAFLLCLVLRPPRKKNLLMP